MVALRTFSSHSEVIPEMNDKLVRPALSPTVTVTHDMSTHSGADEAQRVGATDAGGEQADVSSRTSGGRARLPGIRLGGRSARSGENFIQTSQRLCIQRQAQDAGRTL